MRALQITDLSGPESALKEVDLPEPEPSHMLTPGSGVVIDVHAAGVSFPELLQTRGQYQMQPDLPFVPGNDVAGVVRSAPESSGLSEGDRVAACCLLAGWAEVAVAPEFLTFRLSDELDFAQGSGLVMNYHTAYFSLKMRGRLADGETVLVHGAAGGVGTAAVQLAAAAGARVVASVRNRDHHAAVAALGAERVVEPAEAASAAPFDVILELVGGPNLPADVEALATWGRITVIGTPAGSRVELDLRQLMAKRGRLLASSLRTRSLEEKADAARRVEAQALPLVAAGRLRIPVHATFPLAAAQEAYDRFAAGGKLGKLVLVTGSGSSSGPPAAPRPAA
jgi:NADPH:quinone reductase